MKTSPRALPRRWAAAGILLATVTLTGCSAESAPGHDKRLSKAAGLARITLVCPKDLWEETRPPEAGANQVKAKVAEITSGPRANRGLVRVTMSGTNLVAYLKELDDNARPDPLTETSNKAASQRVYEAIAPAVDRIENSRSEKDPEPEIIIDDTIRDKK